MKPSPWPMLLAGVALLLTATAASADNGNAPPTMSFFSGGDGAQAHWMDTVDQPPMDTDNQAIAIHTTNDAPTFTKGYAGILFHHVTGIPVDAFPDSEFWVKSPAFAGSSLGSPRLVVEFQNAAGVYDGYADLRPITLTSQWQDVSDVGANYANNGWDIMQKVCPFSPYQEQWSVVQQCFQGDTTLAVFLTTDPYGIEYLIDDITVNGKTFSSASDNGGGNNDTAGPDATTDTSLLPPLIFPPL